AATRPSIAAASSADGSRRTGLSSAYLASTAVTPSGVCCALLLPSAISNGYPHPWTAAASGLGALTQVRLPRADQSPHRAITTAPHRLLIHPATRRDGRD